MRRSGAMSQGFLELVQGHQRGVQPKDTMTGHELYLHEMLCSIVIRRGEYCSI